MFSSSLFLFLTVFAFQVLTAIGGRKLDDYISHFEELHYNTQEVHEGHLRHKRSIDKNVNVKLEAFNRTFHLELVQNSAGFSPDHVLEFGIKKIKPDLSFLYGGSVKGHSSSKVTGAIIEGVFRGSIHIPKESETYHVEKSHRFFDKKPVFHSVIYKESDMDLDPYRDQRVKDRFTAQKTGTCGYDSAMKWMSNTVEAEVVPENRAKRTASNLQDAHNKYTADSNSAEEPHRRTKRMTLGEKNSCFMSLTSDKVFWDTYMEQANNNRDVARDEILAFFHSHVNAINKIYGETDFETDDKSLSYTGVQFTVQKSTVMTDENCNDNTNVLYDFCELHVDVSNFLNINSMFNHNTFCLAYVFTSRDFMYGTLGLAWVGSASSASGGICERYKPFTEGSTKVSKSLNTGIVTIRNYGKDVPKKVSQLTFAHEVGHNFGSPHDSGKNCAPYGTDAPDANLGNYIMFASATVGDKEHNSEFSSCSKDKIARVLDAVLNTKYNCFKKAGPFCGNGILEDGEECDCGFSDDCKDNCCIPRNSQSHNENMYCKLTPGSKCSPSQGPCCSKQCDFISAASNFTCRYKQECASASKCDGNNATCPPSTNEPDGSYCQKFGFTCKAGECAASLCEAFNWTECFATSLAGSKTADEQAKLCKLGCRSNISGVDTGCVLSDNEAMMRRNNYNDYIRMVTEVRRGRALADITLSGSGVQLAPGSPCNNFQGYCDVFNRCRGVKSDGPLSRLKNLIFDPKTLKDVSNWIQEHWWAVLLMAIGLVLAMGLFIKFCAVHTPSSNPKAKPARKLSETMTLRRRRNQHRQAPSQSQPQQVRYPQNRDYRDRDYSYGRDQELLPDPKYPGKSQLGPPPPYPGSSSASSHAGPPHGHGKKGKGRKSKDIEMGRV